MKTNTRILSIILAVFVLAVAVCAMNASAGPEVDAISSATPLIRKSGVAPGPRVP